MTSANEFLMSGGATSAKFEALGVTVTGTIAREPEVQQQRDITTGEPKFWNDGKPQQQIQIVLATQDRNDAEDDGERALYVKGNMLKAVREAVKKSGAKGLAVGGQLTVTYIGDGEVKTRGFNPPKIYGASYAPPATATANNVLAHEPVQAAPQTYQQQPPADPWNSPAAQAPAFAQQTPAAAPVATPAGVTPEALAALQNLTAEQRQMLGIPG
jgi:hypothetical protein